MRKTTIFSLSLLLAGAFSLAISQDHVVKRRAISPHGVVSIENIAGSIEVVGWDRDEVEVTANLGRGTEGVDLSGDEDNLSIEVELMDDHDDIEGSDLIVRVPRGVRLEIETVSAKIDVSDVDGDLELESVSGNITVQGSPKSVELQNISGRINLVTDRALEEGEFQTVVGSIIVEAALAPHGRLEFESVSGSIEMRLPSQVSAEFELSTFSGDIRNDFGQKARHTSELLPTKELRFTLGRGDAHVSAETVTGSISLRKQ